MLKAQTIADLHCFTETPYILSIDAANPHTAGFIFRICRYCEVLPRKTHSDIQCMGVIQQSSHFALCSHDTTVRELATESPLLTARSNTTHGKICCRSVIFERPVQRRDGPQTEFATDVRPHRLLFGRIEPSNVLS